MVKQLDSPWKYGERSGAWVKLKPEYVTMQEIDAVIIGCKYGTGKNSQRVGGPVHASVPQPECPREPGAPTSRVSIPMAQSESHLLTRPLPDARAPSPCCLTPPPPPGVCCTHSCLLSSTSS